MLLLFSDKEIQLLCLSFPLDHTNFRTGPLVEATCGYRVGCLQGSGHRKEMGRERTRVTLAQEENAALSVLTTGGQGEPGKGAGNSLQNMEPLGVLSLGGSPPYPQHSARPGLRRGTTMVVN